MTESDGAKSSVTLTVFERLAESIQLTMPENKQEVFVGDEPIALDCSFQPDDATDKTLSYTISDERLATVKDGVLTPLAPGSVKITATTGNQKTSSIDLKISVHQAEKVELNFSTSTFRVGQPVSCRVTITPPEAAFGYVITSSDPSIAKVLQIKVKP